MHQKQKPVLPSHDSPNALSESFSNFFISKIKKIRTDIDVLNYNSVDLELPLFGGLSFESFSPVTEDEVKKVIIKARSTTCDLDVMPTSLLKSTIDSSLSHITHLLNISLSSGIVPDCLKHAIIRPLLKKTNLDHEILKNYRPVSFTLHF